MLLLLGVKEGSSDIVSVGALSSGSIVNGFTKIEMTGAISTTGQITGGSLDIDDVVISGSTIGHSNDSGLITLSNGLAKVMETLKQHHKLKHHLLY